MFKGFNKEEIVSTRMKDRVTGEWNFKDMEETVRRDGCIVDDNFTADSPYFSVYLGSILNIAPSGKYYTPWACSNVSRFEAMQDEWYWHHFDNLTLQHNCWTQSGEGDALDVLLCTTLTP